MRALEELERRAYSAGNTREAALLGAVIDLAEGAPGPVDADGDDDVRSLIEDDLNFYLTKALPVFNPEDFA